MARIARVVVTDIPHHVIQRGNRRQTTFFNDGDYAAYKSIMAEQCRKHRVAVWAYCFMPNHVHMILVPEGEYGFNMAIGEAHRRYTRMINFRERWRGHLWQERFSSYPMDEKYLIAAARYIEQNPVRAQLVKNPADWKWSSASSHLRGIDDGFVVVKPLLDILGDWHAFLYSDAESADLLRAHERTGRPLGAETFVEQCERQLSRNLKRQKPGPKKRSADN